MFQRHYLDYPILLYPILPKKVYLYDNQFQININVFSYFYDNSRSRYPLVISRKTWRTCGQSTLLKQPLCANHQHLRSCFKYNKILKSKTFLPAVPGWFFIRGTFARQNQLCTWDDFISILHVLPTPGSKQEQIKFTQYKNCTKAPFFIYADFESILELLGRQVKRTTYTQQHKVCAAAAILISRFYEFTQTVVTKVGGTRSSSS